VGARNGVRITTRLIHFGAFDNGTVHFNGTLRGHTVFDANGVPKLDFFDVRADCS
jgi:hypothetical protein